VKETFAVKNLCFALTALALLPAADLAYAQEGVLLDYRDRQFRNSQPGVNAAEKARLSAALAGVSSGAVKALGKDFFVLGEASGQLATAGEVDFFLLSLALPVAADPFPKTAAQVIVAMKGKDAVATNELPAATQYAQLRGTVDIDGDKNSEVLLEAGAYNMGQSVTNIDAVKLQPDSATSVVQSIPEVYSDSCDNPSGTKVRAAKSISLSGGKLVATAYPESCGLRASVNFCVAPLRVRRTMCGLYKNNLRITGTVHLTPPVAGWARSSASAHALFA
jgi:hypothetical protein